MRYRASPWLALGGISTAAACVAFAWLYWWIVRPHDDVDEGQRLILIVFAPVVAGALGYGIWHAGKWTWKSLTTYEVLPDGLVIRTPCGSRTVAWGRVRDFSLLPGAFPHPPRTLVLFEDGPRCTTVALDVRNADGFRRDLVEHFFALAGHGPDRVRYGGPAPSLIRTRWRRHGSDMLMTYAALVLFLLFVLGVPLVAQNHVNYWRIRARHHAASAEILSMKSSDRRVSVAVRFTTPEGQAVELRRSALTTFAAHHRVGGLTSVEYLPHNPGVGRLKDWDRDSREWILVLFGLPLIYASYRWLAGCIAAWVRSLRVQARWQAAPVEGYCLVTATPGGIRRIREAFPNLHDGAVVFRRLAVREGGTTVERNWGKLLTRTGIECRLFARNWLAVASDDARRLWDRVGPTPHMVGDYVVMSAASAADAERMALGATVGSDTDAARYVDARRFVCEKDILGPMDPADATLGFNRWVDGLVRELYEFVPPRSVCDVDYATMLRIDPANGDYHLLVERTKLGPRVWVRPGEEAAATQAEWRGARWYVVHGAYPPAILRRRTFIGRLTAVVFWPLLLLAATVQLLISPLYRMERRLRHKAVERAYRSAAKATGVDEEVAVDPVVRR